MSYSFKFVINLSKTTQTIPFNQQYVTVMLVSRYLNNKKSHYICYVMAF